MMFLCRTYLMVNKVQFKWYYRCIEAHALLTVLPTDWLMKYNLATKRIYARVRNTLPDQINNRGGFAGGFYKGERGMILDGQDEWQILVAVKQ